MFFQRSVWFRYSFASALVLLAFAVRVSLQGILADRIPFMTFFPCVAIVAYYCGIGPAVLATMSCMILAARFIGFPTEIAGALSQGVFVVTSLGIILFARRIVAQQETLRAEDEKLYKAELSLRKAGKQFELASEIAGLGVCEWDLRTNEITWNKKHFEHYGYEPFSFRPTLKHFLEYIYPEDVEKVKGALESSRIQRVKVNLQFRLQLPTGEMRWLHAMGDYKYDESGAAIALHGAVRNITEEKNASEKLRQSEERERKRSSRLEVLMNTVPAAIWVADGPECSVITGNRYSCELSNGRKATLSEADGAPNATAFVNGLELQKGELPIEVAARTGCEVRNFEMEYRYEDGRSRWLLGGAVPVRDAQGRTLEVVSAFVDITEKKRFEQAMARNEERLRAAQKASGAGVWDWDIKTGVLYWSPEFYQLYGLPPETAPTFDRWIASIHAEDRKRMMDETQRVLESGINFRLDFRIVHPERGERWIQTIGESICDKREVPVRMLGIALDITDRKQSERALAAAKEFNEQLLASIEDCINVIDLKGRLSFLSPGGIRALNISDPASVLHRDYESFWKEDDRAVVRKAIESARAGGAGRFEGLCPTQDGKPKWWHVVITPMFDLEGKVENLLAVSHDITERKQADSKIRFQAGLLDSVGEAVVATDLSGNVIFWNREAERLYGWTESEAIGKHILTLTPAETSLEQGVEIMDALRKGNPWKGEFPVRRSDGSTFLAMVTDTPITNDQGELIGIVGVSHDITKRKKEEVATREQASRLHLALSAADLGDWTWNAATDSVTLSPRGGEIYGLPAGEAIQWKIIDQLLSDEDARRARRALKEAIQLRSDYAVEYLVTRPDGSRRWVGLKGRATYGSDRAVVGMSGVVQDVTARKEADQEIQKFALLAANSNEFIGICDLNGIPSFVNQAGLRIVGLAEEELQKTPVIEFFFPEDRDFIHKEFLPKVASEGWGTTEIRFRHFQTGDPVWMVYNVTVIKDGDGKPRAFATISQNITEQRRTLEALRNSEQRIQLVIDSAAAFIIYCDCSNRFQFVNRPYAERLGLTVDQVVGKHIEEILGPIAYSVIEPYIRRAIEGERVEFEVTMPYEQIGDRYIHCTYVPDLAPGGQVRGYVGLITDMTERREKEEQLRENEARLRTALDAGKLGTWEWDIQTNKVFWSDRLYEFHGLKPSEFSGTVESFTKLIHPDDARMIGEKIEAALESRAPYELEFRAVRPDGEIRWLYTSARVIFDDAGKAVRLLGGTIDLTDRKRMEMELREAQQTLSQQADLLEKQVAERTASLHETTQQLEAFCYTVAHDLRAPLRAQQGFAFALLEEYGLLLDDTAKDYLNRIINSAAHLNQLVSDLLAYARLSRDKLQFEPIHLTELIAVVLSQNANQIRSRGAEVTREKRFPRVLGHELTLSLSIENLLSNAMKFTRPGVKPRIHLSSERKGDYVRIWIEDNGIGIAPEHQTQIFGVFHRLHTKAYPGTGIGLALVDKAIQRMGGRVGVESEPEKGSRFWFELPAAEETNEI